MKKLLLTLFVLSSLITYGQATFTNSGGNWTYNQDFNTLTTNTATSTTTPPLATVWTDNSSLANFYVQRSGTGTTIVANAGSSNTGALYSYGIISPMSTERALGSLGSGTTGNFTYGIRLKNNTGSTMYSLQVSYVGEQWRNSGVGSAQTVSFSYLLSNSAFTSVSLQPSTSLPSGFVSVSALDFTSPKSTGGIATLDGNAVGNKTALTKNIIFDTPLPADGEVILRWYDPDHTGADHGLSIDDLSLTAGLTPIPTLTVIPTSLNNINYLENNGPSGASSFSVSGANLSPASDILTITAPTNFEVSNNASTGFGASTTIPYTNGSLQATTVYVRLASGLAAGAYGGATTYVVSSGGTASNVNVAVTGTVTTGNECGTAQTIASVRSTIPAQASFTGTSGITVDGTITGIFGANKFYLSDATGGIAIFTTGIVTNNSLKLGDRVKVTGSTARFNGEAEILTVTCVTRIAAGTVPAPKTFDANNPPTGVALSDFLASNEGDYVKIISANLNASGTFSTGQNYSVITCNEQGGTEIRIDATATTLGGFTVPSVTQDIAGVLGHYITADGGTDKLQLYPRNTTDFSNSAVTCTLSSGGANGCGVATITNDAPTLDVVTWNVEWLGHPTNGPSQSGTNDVTQIANAKTILNSIGADVFMLEEICSYNAANPTDNTTAFGKLLEGLNTTYGANAYSGECSPAVSSSVVDPNAQRVCIIYKNSVVEKISGRVMFDGFTPDTYATATPSQFWASGRKPYIFKAKVTLNSVVDTINFVGLHAKSGSDVTSYNRRKFDVKAMYDTLQAQYPNAKILIGGDINDDVDISIYPNNISSYSPFLYTNPDETSIAGTRPNADFDAVTKALSDIKCASTASYPDIIDHFILSNELKSGSAKFNYKSGSASNMHPYSLVSNYSTTTSDHFPTLIRLRSQPCPTKPVITAASLNICGSGSVTLNVTGCDGTLNWTGGLTGSSITVSPTSTKSYRVACTVVDCTSDSSDVATVTVKPIPSKPTITPSTTSICSGSSATLTSSDCSGGTLNWTGGLSGSSITVSLVATKSYKVACTVDGCTSDSSDVATVTVKPIPSKPTITPSTTSICSGSSATLTSSDCSGGTLNWTGGLSGSSITVSLTATKSYKVSCTVDGCTSDSSDVATVTVKPIPSKPTIIPNSTLVCSGGSATLFANGCAGGTLNWTGGLSGLSITVNPTLTKEYKAACTINGCTSDSSDVATVTVRPKPTKPVITPSTPAICVGSSVTLTASACDGGVLNWTDGMFGSSITVTPTATRTYKVACMIMGCVSDSSDVTVTVNAIPVAPSLLANPESIVLGQSSSLTASNCAGIVTWSLGAATTNPLSVSPVQNTSYTATCTVNGCISVASSPVTVSVTTANPCQSQVTLVSTADDYTSGVQLKEASSTNGKITATNLITGSAKVTYQSKVIELNAGFKADSGAVFTAQIGGCN